MIITTDSRDKSADVRLSQVCQYWSIFSMVTSNNDVDEAR